MPGTNLTRDEATARAAVVAVDHYDVALDLTTSETTFRTHDHGDLHERRSPGRPPSST